MINRIFELQEKHQWTSEELNMAISAVDEALPIALHLVAFEPVFRMQASPELLTKYDALIATRGILGCYLQTELAHGTNVGSLETTATYISETQEFEIHSPTLTSSKWWIGALGKTATHGVVQAKLILPGGKDIGPHLFFLQLRSMDDHKVLPGITIGDIGPKVMMGYPAPDNGFARFDHVRIPKGNMLSKFAQVTKEGKYVRPPHAKLSYGGMMYIRSSMVTGAGWTISRAATIAMRYTTVRRQGERGPDGLEIQVINYPSTYYRLLPILAHAYVFIELGRSVSQAFASLSARLAQGDTSLLAEMHATTSGLKVLATTTGIADIEVARRSMGGHGYSVFSGLGHVYADYVPSATYEGDNFALDQQVVRGALKSLKAFLSLVSGRSLSPDAVSAALSPSTAYLRLLLPALPSNPSAIPKITESRWENPTDVILLLEWRAALVVQALAKEVEAHPSESVSGSVDAGAVQRAARAITDAFVAARVGTMIQECPLQGEAGKAVKGLYMLYLLTSLESGLVDLLSFGIVTSALQQPGTQDVTLGLRHAIKALCEVLLPNAIGLTDAFGFTDWELHSALGVSDGRVYEALWAAAQREPLNAHEVTPAYEESIKPILQRGQRLAGAKL
ncbi:hypothetical protein HGRIS_006806 [Hohenbuehelia grisea]